MEAPLPDLTPLLYQVRARLDAGLSGEERGEIVRLLASVVVHMDQGQDGRPRAKVVVTYCFPEGVVETRAGTGSSRRQVRHPIDDGV